MYGSYVRNQKQNKTFAVKMFLLEVSWTLTAVLSVHYRDLIFKQVAKQEKNK